MKFNSNFYKPNREYTKETAESVMESKGIKEDGTEYRVSDHHLTGRRAFDIVQFWFNEPKVFSMKKVKIGEK